METVKRGNMPQTAAPAGATRLRGQESRVQQHSGSTRILVDVVIALDCTGSMGECISGVLKALLHFVDILSKSQFDVRIGLVLFRDELIGEMPRCLPVGTPPETIKSILASTIARGGGDIPESSLPAIMHALDLSGFRPGARKVLLLVTDAPPHDPERGLTSSTVSARLKEEQAVLFACTPRIEPYVGFCNRSGGTQWELEPDISSDAFADLLVHDVAPATVRTVKRGAADTVPDYALEARRTVRQ